MFPKRSYSSSTMILRPYRFLSTTKAKRIAHCDYYPIDCGRRNDCRRQYHQGKRFFFVSPLLLSSSSSSSSSSKRFIWSYIRDVMRTGSFQPTNPLWNAIQTGTTCHRGEDIGGATTNIIQSVGDGTGSSIGKSEANEGSIDKSDINTDNETTTMNENANSEKMQSVTPKNVIIPSLEGVQPYHVMGAMKLVQEEYLQKLDQLRSSVENREKVMTVPALFRQIDSMLAPIDSIKHICNHLGHCASEPQKEIEWGKALADLDRILQSNAKNGCGLVMTLHEDKTIYEFIRRELNSGTSLTAEMNWTAKEWIRNYEHYTGNNLPDDEVREEYDALTEAIQETKLVFQQTSTEGRSIELIGAMYNTIGRRNRQAHLLGYANAADQVMETRTATVAEVHELHKQLAENLLPLLKTESDATAMNVYLSSSSYDKNKARKMKGTTAEDRMLRLQDYVTLDGALLCLDKLSQDLFGVGIVEEKDTRHLTWHPDVRIFHFVDRDGECLGTVFIDPYHRRGKSDFSVTTPLFPRSETRKPSVAISLGIEPPTWDTDPAFLTWEDVESLFREMGHAFQLIVSRPTLGTLARADKMPLDLYDVFPKFMACWTTETKIIYALLAASGDRHTSVDSDILAEGIDLALHLRAQKKISRVVEDVFHGSLELILFSEFDVRGGESIVDLQTRLAKELMPHSLPREKDISPLFNIFLENSNGNVLGWYRHVWSDALSSTFFQQIRMAYSSQDGHTLRMFQRFVEGPGACVEPASILREMQVEKITADALIQQLQLKNTIIT